jgi:hypothetical protein
MFVVGWTSGGAPYGVYEDEIDAGLDNLDAHECDEPYCLAWVGVSRNFRGSAAVTPDPATTPATKTVAAGDPRKIIGGYLPTSGTFSSNDHRR